MRILFPLTCFIVIGALSGCAEMQRSVAAPAPATAATMARTPVLGAGKSAAALDKTSNAEKQAALNVKASASERSLGKVAVSLGSPAEQGIWLRSALVKAASKGRVVTSAGQSAAVELLPGSGAAQLSLAAYRALGLSLTALPEVTVYAN